MVRRVTDSAAVRRRSRAHSPEGCTPLLPRAPPPPHAGRHASTWKAVTSERRGARSRTAGVRRVLPLPLSPSIWSIWGATASPQHQTESETPHLDLDDALDVVIAVHHTDHMRETNTPSKAQTQGCHMARSMPGRRRRPPTPARARVGATCTCRWMPQRSMSKPRPCPLRTLCCIRLRWLQA